MPLLPRRCCPARARFHLILIGLLAAAALPTLALAVPDDPLVGVIHRINTFFHRQEIDGITRDRRYALNPTEVTRLSVVSQLLGYNELYRTHSGHAYYVDIVDRADFLVAHYDEIISNTAFDGMLGYALLASYEVTGNPVYFSRGVKIVNRLKDLHGFQVALNWGLMAAMALAKHYQLTGDPISLARTRDILNSLKWYQHGNGSFPHYCIGSTDIHYTAWMGMELLTIKRIIEDPAIDPVLEGIHAFLEDRIGDDGRTRYEASCPGRPGCTIWYYSIATGCRQDYDTRSWVNELGYDAMVFDYFRESRYEDVMRFLYSLETKGAFADKWDFWPSPTDPAAPWASPDTSVIRTSVIFWSLASIYNARSASTPALLAARVLPENEPATVVDAADGNDSGGDWVRTTGWLWADSLAVAGIDPSTLCGAGNPTSDEGPSIPDLRRRAGRFGEAGAHSGRIARLGPVIPNPAHRDCDLHFNLARERTISLTIYDASGRRVRGLISGPRPAGEQSVHWDRRVDAGGLAPEGLYFVRLEVGSQVFGAKLLLIR